jgi:hypothetical protein
MMKLLCACPGSREIMDGGGKDERRPLGCGLEKRPPCPRRTGQKGMPRSSERGVSLNYNLTINNDIRYVKINGNDRENRKGRKNQQLK